MPAWTCPSCQRRFGRRGQGHECTPALSLKEYFSTGPARERPIFDAVMAHLTTLGPVHVEPVSVGIFLKRSRSFAQLRPKRAWVALSFALPHRVDDSRIARKVIPSGANYHHVVNLRSADDLDDQVRDWLTEAYQHSPV